MKFSEAFLKQHIRTHPKSLMFAYYADQLLIAGKLEQAYELCKYGVEINPRYATGWLIFGKIAQAAEQYDFAKTCWLKALNEDRMCLQAATLLLDDENLDLQPEQIVDISRAILMVDAKNPLALRRMDQVMNDSVEMKVESPEAESSTDEEAVPDVEVDKETTDDKFDIYGVDKDRVSGIEETLNEIEKKETSDKIESGSPKDDSGDVIDIENIEPPKVSRLGSPEKDKPSGSTSNRKNEVELRITPRLATFTFADVLQSQGLYNQAYEVLEMMRQKNVSIERIEKKQKELKQLMEEG